MSALDAQGSSPSPFAARAATPELASGEGGDESIRPTDLGGLKRSIRRYLHYTLARQWKYATPQDLLTTVSLAVRERVIDSLLETEHRYNRAGAKRLYYLSMEFLMGRALGNNLANLGLYETVAQALREMGTSLDEVIETERDAALGNGGLGRLAACFLDSLATLGIPGYGYGINYEFGLFRQVILNGYQKEHPDHWGQEGYPWLVERPSSTYLVPVYGRVENGRDHHGKHTPIWLDTRFVVGVTHEMPVIGYGGKTVNFLRLFSARASADLDMEIFNAGDYLRAVEEKIGSERISKVLYPSDNVSAGRELRLLQEYFLVASALRDILRRFHHEHRDLTRLPEKVAIQLNDTHPALAVAELMRVLVDEHDLTWETAWDLTHRTLAYTNHTLLPEALEKWPVPLMERVLPRHLQVIYEINHRFLQTVAQVWPGDTARLGRMSIIEESTPKQVRMAHLAIVGSHSTNGVAALHSQLLKTRVFKEFAELWPNVFNNKTNGVTQRRWLLHANRPLAKLLTETIGDGWITNLEELRRLEPFADDAGFRDAFRRVKRQNKERLANEVRDQTGISIDASSLYDIQAKRIHLYKRQLLSVLFVIHEYLSLVEDGVRPAAPRTHIFAGKAAPGYWAAKQVIKLIHSVAEVVNHDPRSRDWIRVVFVPDYRVSAAEQIIPAADLSEQISTAGMEASGTGNMKFAMNGALTIGTLDGANIEIREHVGDDNIFIFGLRSEEVAELKAERSYDPEQICRANPQVARVVDAVGGNLFCVRDPGLFRSIYERLIDPTDEYVHLADLESYIATQGRASELYLQPEEWARRALLNVARVGVFSSDRTIQEYARDIWGVSPVE